MMCGRFFLNHNNRPSFEQQTQQKSEQKMGRRKKAQKKVIKKKRYEISSFFLSFTLNLNLSLNRPTVPTSFKCCMCNHDDAVECDLGALSHSFRPLSHSLFE